MRPNPQFPADLVTFTGEILNGKLHILCSEASQHLYLEENKCLCLISVTTQNAAYCTKNEVSIQDFLSKCDQICSGAY